MEQLLREDNAHAADPPATDPVVPGSALALDRRRRRPVQVVVHVPVTTALGLDDEPARVRDLGGTSRAYAQATAEAVRQALLDMVASPSVMPVDPEPQDRPSAALARPVRTRHPRCDFLTCSCPSRQADLEHDRPYHQRGTTSAANLTPRSRWCHGAKQRGWRARPLPDGSTVWRSPSGRQYPAQPQHRPPPSLPPDAFLPPPHPPPPRDDDGPPYGIPDPLDDAPLTIEPPRRRSGSRQPPLPAPPASGRGWPDDPPF